MQQLLDSLGRHPIPGREEQLLLGRSIRTWQDWSGGPEQAPARIRRAGKRALDRLVSGNLRLLIPTVKRFYRRGLEMEDLFQNGCLGLIRAAEKYDPERGYSFTTYASWWIAATVRNALNERDVIKVPRHVRELCGSASRIASELRQEGAAPTLDAVAERLNRKPSALADVSFFVGRAQVLPLDAICDSRTGEESQAMVACERESPEEALFREERRELLYRAVESLNSDERSLFDEVEIGGATLRDAAKRREQCRETLRERRNQIRGKLRRQLAAFDMATS